VTVVADGALPLDPLAWSIGGSFGAEAARPNVSDRTVDMQWGFPAGLVGSGVYADHASLDPRNQFYYSGFIQHEMGHARYLVDVYAWDVFDGTAGSRVDIHERGARVAGSRYLPGTSAIFNGRPGLQLHRTPHQGLMTTDWRYVDRYSAAALNLIAGQRAIDGNFNEPANLGVFLHDASGRALAGARVQVFQAEPGDASAAVYSKVFDDTPDVEARADGQGQVLLSQNPFSRRGRVVLRDEYANGTVILRVEHEGRVGYTFLESSEFNLEYWRGHRDVGQYELVLALF
jgi:hypothetical protein